MNITPAMALLRLTLAATLCVVFANALLIAEPTESEAEAAPPGRHRHQHGTHRTVKAHSPIGAQIPRLSKRIVQYGIPRTASTFQWTILCKTMQMLHPDQARCSYEDTVTEVGPYEVVRTHKMPPKSDGNVLVFTSTRDGQELWPDSVYVQNLESVIEDPIAEIEKYRKIFSLSASETAKLQDYMKYWMPIRECCGVGMSLARRQKLHFCPVTAKDYGCDQWDLTSAELHHTQTALWSGGKYPDYNIGFCANGDRRIKDGEDWNKKLFVDCKSLAHVL